MVKLIIGKNCNNYPYQIFKGWCEIEQEHHEKPSQSVQCERLEFVSPLQYREQFWNDALFSLKAAVGTHRRTILHVHDSLKLIADILNKQLSDQTCRAWQDNVCVSNFWYNIISAESDQSLGATKQDGRNKENEIMWFKCQRKTRNLKWLSSSNKVDKPWSLNQTV